MLFWDPTMILLIPAIILAVWAKRKLKKTYEKYSDVHTHGLDATSVARRLLDSAGLHSVDIKRVEGELSDHYDPRSRELKLSEGVHNTSSVAAIGVAAHEAGHAIQHSQSYAPLNIRNAIVPVVKFGSSAAWPIFIIGFFMRTPLLFKIGIILFSGAVFFQIITLPVEFNASKRALKYLENRQILSGDKLNGAKKVLNAAALTYVASAAAAVLQLLRMILLSRRA